MVGARTVGRRRRTLTALVVLVTTVAGLSAAVAAPGGPGRPARQDGPSAAHAASSTTPTAAEAPSAAPSAPRPAAPAPAGSGAVAPAAPKDPPPGVRNRTAVVGATWDCDGTVEVTSTKSIGNVVIDHTDGPTRITEPFSAAKLLTYTFAAADYDGLTGVWIKSGNNGTRSLGERVDLTAPTGCGGDGPGVVGLEAGYTHTCVIVTEGGVRCWGENAEGELGDGTRTERWAPVAVVDASGEPLTGATAVSGGTYHTCAVVSDDDVDGAVLCWGDNASGQLGDGTTTRRTRAVPVVVDDGGTPLTGATAIAAGYQFTCAVVTDDEVEGGVRCWGQNNASQLGDGTATPSLRPVAVVVDAADTPLQGAVAVAAGYGEHACAALASGEVRCWGSNGRGQLGVGGTGAPSPTAVAVFVSDFELLSGVTGITVGESHSCAVLADGAGARCWGDNVQGQLGTGDTVSSSTPVPVIELLAPSAIASEAVHTCAAYAVGVACWGQNSSGQVGIGRSGGVETTPLAVIIDERDTPLAEVVAVATGDSHSCALQDDGDVWCWGYNGEGSLGDGTTTNRTLAVQVVGLGERSDPDPVTLDVGAYHACAVVDGGVRCWGRNGDGELGDGTQTDSAVPVVVVESGGAPLAGATDVAVGSYFTCALVTDGEVACWGDNGQGQLGDGTTTRRLTPVRVGGITGAIALVAGEAHACALLDTGTVRCWGYNDGSQLGVGMGPNQSTPVDVEGVAAASALAAGVSHTCAVMVGTVRCWGANGNGQAGDGTTDLAARPVVVRDGAGEPLTGVTAVGAGNAFTCALLEGGGAACWGSNGTGRLGRDTSADSATELTAGPVTGLAGASALAVGYDHACALVSGAVTCWGANGWGELGDGSTSTPAPGTRVTVSGLSGVTAIAAGEAASCARTSSGAVWCWGYNGDGQLGDGTTDGRTSPVRVVGIGPAPA